MNLNWSSYLIMFLFVIYLCLAAAQAQQGYPRGGPTTRFSDAIVTENIDFTAGNNRFANNNGYRNNGYPSYRQDQQFQGYPESRGVNELDASGAIQGRAGVDYPVFSSVPPTSFSCSQQQYPGYYADPETQCQAFHICQQGGRQDSFLCPNGTLFNQVYLVCDSWNNVDCSQASELALTVNEAVFRDMQAADERLRQSQGYQYNQVGAQSRQVNSVGPRQDLGFARAAPLTEYTPRAIFGTDIGTPSSQYGSPKNNQFNARSNGQSNYDNGIPRSQYGAPRTNFDGPSFDQANARFNGQNSNYDNGTPSSQYGAPRTNFANEANALFNGQNTNYDNETPSSRYGTPRINFDGPSFEQANARFNGQSSNFANGAPSFKYGVPRNSFDNARSNVPSSRYGVPSTRSFSNDGFSTSRAYLPPGK